MLTSDQIVDTAKAIGERLIIAAVVLVVGVVLSQLLRRLVVRFVARPAVAAALGPSTTRLLGSAVFYILLAVTFSFVLIALGVPTVLVVLVIAGVLAIVGMAVRQSVSNFAATVIFLLFQPFRRGELIETMGHIGTVSEILLFNTVLQLADGRQVSLPNSRIQETGVTNHSRLGSLRADVSFAVAYDQNLARIREILFEIADADPRILTTPPFDVIIDDFDDHGIRVKLLPMVSPSQAWTVRNDLRMRIKERFDNEGIRFAAPIREVRFASPLETTLANSTEL